MIVWPLLNFPRSQRDSSVVARSLTEFFRISQPKMAIIILFNDLMNFKIALMTPNKDETCLILSDFCSFWFSVFVFCRFQLSFNMFKLLFCFIWILNEFQCVLLMSYIKYKTTYVYILNGYSFFLSNSGIIGLEIHVCINNSLTYFE